MIKIIEYKGFILQQTSYNWHYTIFDKETGKMMLHCTCTRELNEEEMKQKIEKMFILRDMLEEKILNGIGPIAKGLLKKVGEN